MVDSGRHMHFAEEVRNSPTSPTSASSPANNNVNSPRTRTWSSSVYAGSAASRGWAGDSIAGRSMGSEMTPLGGKSSKSLDPISREKALRAHQNKNNLAWLKTYTNATGKDMQQVGFHKNLLLDVIDREERQITTCIGFPLVILYFVLFASVFQVIYPAYNINIQETQLREALSAPAREVVDIAGVYSWVEDVLVPYLWSCPNVQADNGEEGQETDAGGLCRGQDLLGGFQISTSRGHRKECEVMLGQPWNCFPEVPTVTSTDDQIFNGWDSAIRRLSELEGNRDWATSTNRWLPRGLRGLLERDADARRDSGRASMPAGGEQRRPRQRARRPSFREHRRTRRKQQAEELREKRRLEVMMAHLKGSMPSLSASTVIYKYVVPMSMTSAQVKEVLGFWKSSGDELIINTTTHLTATFLLRNDQEGESGFLTNGILTLGRISFLFSRGGQVYSETFLGSLNLETPPFALAGFGLWAAIVAIITFQQCVSLMRAVKKGDCCSYLLKLLNLYEWTLLITAWLIVLLIVLGVLGMNNFNDLFENYDITRATTSRITIQDFDRSWYKKLSDVAENLVTLDGNATFFVAYFHIMIVIRFFIATRGHVRLAIVVNTLGHGVDDLLHLFVVFAVIFSSFVMAGHILFGHRMEPFATVKGSLGYCAQIVLQHQYDSTAIAEEDFWTSTFWTCIFVVLVVLVVVNIVLAMIFDSYGEAMMEIHNKDTIWHTAWYLWTYMRNGASHADLAKALKKEGQQPVSAKRLRQICPKVSNEQIDHLYDFAKLRLVTKVANTRRIALAEAMSHILLGINELRHGTYRMIGDTVPVERPKSTFSSVTSDESSTSSSQAPVVATPSKLPRVTHGPPEKMPLWVEEGLMAHLRKRQSTMDQLFLQLQQIRGEIRKRGLGVNCDPVPREEPEEPSRTGSRRLDQTLTGTEMKPMITPGQERKKGIVQAPRSTQPPSGYSILQRLGRAA